jgi:YegS/Rv2252/BmrU family lipid kinase
MAQHLVIFNPVAGRGRVAKLWPEIRTRLNHSAVNFEFVATTGPGDAIALARSAAGSYTSLIGIGGDGTISEIVNGLMQHSKEAETIPFAIVPVGNGDDFSKMLPPEAVIGGRGYDWQLAIEKIRAGQSQLYDVGRIKVRESNAPDFDACRYFANIVGVGFGAHTVQNFATVPRFVSGFSAYLLAVLKTMINYPSLRLRVQMDEEAPEDRLTTIAAIGNGRCFGGGFWVCPDARLDDGLLDVMIAKQISRRTILRLLPKLKRGTHVHQSAIEMRRVARIILESDTPFFVEADGELPFSPITRLEADVLPKRLRLMV